MCFENVQSKPVLVSKCISGASEEKNIKAALNYSNRYGQES